MIRNHRSPNPVLMMKLQLHTAIRLLLLSVAITISLSAAPVRADWQTDVGYIQLASELGDDLPDGAGLGVCQVEAAVLVDEEYTWMPDPSNAAFAGKTLNDCSGAPDGLFSGHATVVGRLYYGDPTAMAPGIADIDIYYAGHWMQSGQLRYGNTHQPGVVDCRLANHSWVGGEVDPPDGTGLILRRLDWVVDRDEQLHTVGLTNSISSTRPLLASAFNVIGVGRTDGSHSRQSAAVDDIYTDGRVRPDLTAPYTKTSYTTPIVSAAAALLMQTGHDDPALSTDPVQTYTINRAGQIVYNAERAETVRAALLAGADRFTRNTTDADITDYRLAAENQTGNGLDVRYGAGQVNIHHSYAIIIGGEQNSLEDGSSGAIGPAGFDHDPAFGGLDGSNGAATYTFSAMTGHNLLTAALVWHIEIDGGTASSFDGTAVLYDLNLTLYDITTAETVAQSQSSTDNSEHLWVALIPGHHYEIKISPGSGQSAFDWDYALAWRLDADADQDLIADDLDNCRLTANRLQTDSDEDGFGNHCDCDLDNNGRVDAGDFHYWRLLATVNPSAAYWDASVDFNGDGIADYDDYTIFLDRYGTTAPYE